MLVTRDIAGERELAVSDAFRGLSALSWMGVHGRPGVIAYLPVYGGNPYQSLLYSQLPSVGLQAVPMYDAEQVWAFVDATAGSGLDRVVHLHWLNFVTRMAADETSARTAATRLVDRLQDVKARDARLLWTVHNVLPHDSRYPGVDTELRAAVASLADKIHVMSARTRELAAPYFDIPDDKAVMVPHPAYQGVYPTWMCRDQARSELGIPRGAIVFLLIGAIKPYKGVTELLDAFDELTRQEPGRFVLLVAGAPDPGEEIRRFCDAVSLHPAVLAALKRIPDAEMQAYLRAADVAVFPYRRSLNSGTLALGLTFGLPVVLPSQSGEVTNIEPAFAELYDPDAPGSLRSALAASVRLVTPEARAAAAAAGDRIAAPVVARRFARALREWLDGWPPTRTA